MKLSRYTLTGKEPSFRLAVGWDATHGLGNEPGTLYAQVEDLAAGSNQPKEAKGDAGGDEGADIGDTPEERLLLWVGQGVDDIISDVQVIVEALAPYGSIPLPIQVDLLRDLDLDWPRPLLTVGAALAAICRQVPAARLEAELEEGKSYYLLLNQAGWQVRAWEALGGGDYERAFARMIYTAERDAKQFRRPEPVAGYVSDRAIIFRVHEEGFRQGLPVFTAFARGAMLSGPVVIANESRGLSASQVRRLQEEVLFVDETIRASVSALWYHAWSTLAMR
jgi:hypothetical protein